MSKVLIIAEHLNGKLNPSTARCVSCAQAIKADSIDILVLADTPDAIGIFDKPVGDSFTGFSVSYASPTGDDQRIEFR